MVTTESAKPKRTYDAARTTSNILEVAIHEFSEKGLAGARIDEIAEATKTSKRMIYYYFGSKEGLYLAALEEAYRRMRFQESLLNLDTMPALEALQTLVRYTFDHHRQDEPFIRLVMSENINRGQYLAQSKFIQELNVPAIDAVQAIYQRGVTEGTFRKGLDPLDIHASISGLCFFHVSNQHTFNLIFKRRNFSTSRSTAERRQNIVDLISRFVCDLR